VGPKNESEESMQKAKTLRSVINPEIHL